MSVTIDELLGAVATFQTKCAEAARANRWEAFAAARKELRDWIEAKGLPVTFPPEDGA